MSEEEREVGTPDFEIRRIVVALDASVRSLAALEAAAALAAESHAELVGLFVEDLELLRLAAVPAAIHCAYPSASEQPLSALLMESELRALAERARRALVGAAQRAQVHWSFRTVRGNVSAEVLLAAAEADLLSLGGIGGSIARRLGLGSTARAVIAGARTSLLLAQGRVSPTLPVLTLYDQSPGASRTCRFAARLAASSSRRLTVFLVTPSGRREPAVEDEVARLVASEKLRVRLRWLGPDEKRNFPRVVLSEAGGVLVVSGQSSFLEEATVEKLLRETSCPLLILGGRGDRVVLRPPEPSESF